MYDFRATHWTVIKKTFLPIFLSFALVSCAQIAVDTMLAPTSWSTPAITPLNFLLYNLSAENLKEHGIHPYWLHVVVNLPMMATPPLLYVGAKGVMKSILPSKELLDPKQAMEMDWIVQKS